MLKPSSVICPKELDNSDRQKSGNGIVYKLSCTQCNFVYYGQTERSLKTRIVEHKKAVASFDQKSKVAGHVHLFGHNGNGIAFSMWIYPNALYNTLWGTFARLLYGAVHNLFLM